MNNSERKQSIKEVRQDKTEHVMPKFLSKQKADVPWDKATDLLHQARDLYTESSPYRDKRKVILPTDKPVTLFFISDVHYGSLFCDLDRFKRDIEVIENTPNSYIVFGSNLIDSFIPAHHPDGMQDNPINAGDQAKAMHNLISRLDKEGKALAMVPSPCHEGSVRSASGWDIQDSLFWDTNVQRINNGGTLELEFANGKKFNMAIYHQSGEGNGTKANKNAASWERLRNAQNGEVDAIIIAHSHIAEVEQSFFGKEKILVRMGSYKGNVSGGVDDPADQFQRGHSGRDGEPGGQAITFNPRTGQMRKHMNPMRAAEYQMKLNKFVTAEDTGRLREVFDATKEFKTKLITPKVPA